MCSTDRNYLIKHLKVPQRVFLWCVGMLVGVFLSGVADSATQSNVQATHNTPNNTKSPSTALRDITYSCANPYVKAESIKILWSEANYQLPISVLDGFNSETCLGKVSKNTFMWDRGASQAFLDRHTGALTIKPKKDGVTISLKCTIVE